MKYPERTSHRDRKQIGGFWRGKEMGSGCWGLKDLPWGDDNGLKLHSGDGSTILWIYLITHFERIKIVNFMLCLFYIADQIYIHIWSLWLSAHCHTIIIMIIITGKWESLNLPLELTVIGRGSLQGTSHGSLYPRQGEWTFTLLSWCGSPLWPAPELLVQPHLSSFQPCWTFITTSLPFTPRLSMTDTGWHYLTSHPRGSFQPKDVLAQPSLSLFGSLETLLPF